MRCESTSQNRSIECRHGFVEEMSGSNAGSSTLCHSDPEKDGTQRVHDVILLILQLSHHRKAAQ